MQRLVRRITLYKELHKIHLLAPELRHLADLQPMQHKPRTSAADARGMTGMLCSKHWQLIPSSRTVLATETSLRSHEVR